MSKKCAGVWGGIQLFRRSDQSHSNFIEADSKCRWLNLKRGYGKINVVVRGFTSYKLAGIIMQEVSMGRYLNQGTDSFEKSVNSEIYVDKTGLIKYTNRVMNTLQGYVCVSRPRRFGKSTAANMLTAYYCRGCDSRLSLSRAAWKTGSKVSSSAQSSWKYAVKIQ